MLRPTTRLRHRRLNCPSPATTKLPASAPLRQQLNAVSEPLYAYWRRSSASSVIVHSPYSTHRSPKPNKESANNAASASAPAGSRNLSAGAAGICQAARQAVSAFAQWDPATPYAQMRLTVRSGTAAPKASDMQPRQDATAASNILIGPAAGTRNWSPGAIGGGPAGRSELRVQSPRRG